MIEREKNANSSVLPQIKVYKFIFFLKNSTNFPLDFRPPNTKRESKKKITVNYEQQYFTAQCSLRVVLKVIIKSYEQLTTPMIRLEKRKNFHT
jgi:hypothetical protein